MSDNQTPRLLYPEEPGRRANSVNKEMLTLARESRLLSQSELAAALKVTQGKISKYESGLLAVSDADLERLAEVLDYPKEFFSLTDTVEGFGSACLYHRKRQSLPMKELRGIHATINVIRFHLVRLLQGVEIENANGFHRMDVDEYDGSPETVARLVRASWKLPLGPVRNLVSAVENAGGIVIPCSFGTNKLDAVSHWPRGLPPLFFINRDLPVDRWRFTLAHEIGHIIMHHIPTQDAEREADRFASEFLMPEREIKSDLVAMTVAKAARLKPYWRVSIQALIKRARELGQLTESRYTSLYTQLSKLGYRKNEPAPLAPEEPTIIRDLIRVHQNDLEYTVPQMSKLAVSNERNFRRFFMPSQERPFRIVGN